MPEEQQRPNIRHHQYGRVQRARNSRPV